MTSCHAEIASILSFDTSLRWLHAHELHGLPPPCPDLSKGQVSPADIDLSWQTSNRVCPLPHH